VYELVELIYETLIFSRPAYPYQKGTFDRGPEVSASLFDLLGTASQQWGIMENKSEL
jgi:hypothetical protein